MLLAPTRHRIPLNHDASPASSVAGHSRRCSRFLLVQGISQTFDDNKYVNDLQQEFAEKHEAEQRRQAPKVSDAQAEELERLIAETDTDGDKFRRFFKVKTLNELPVEDYERARRMLEKKKQDKESAA